MLSDDKLCSKSLAQSQEDGSYEMKGHRSVERFRAFLDHGVTMADV